MPRGWSRGPQGQLRPVNTGECAVHVMKIATGEVVERVQKPPLPEEPPRVFARARNVTKASEVDARGGEEAPPPHPMYGPGLPPPGAKAKPGP